MTKLTEQQTIFLEQLRDSTIKFLDQLNDMISTRKSIPESIPLIADYISDINSYGKKLQKESRLKWSNQ